MAAEGSNTDEDVYSLGESRLAESVFLSTRILASSSLRPALELRNSKNVVVASQHGGVGRGDAFDVIADDTYYVVVKGISGQGSRGQYLMDVAVWPTGGVTYGDLGVSASPSRQALPVVRPFGRLDRGELRDRDNRPKRGRTGLSCPRTSSMAMLTTSCWPAFNTAGRWRSATRTPRKPMCNCRAARRVLLAVRAGGQQPRCLRVPFRRQQRRPKHRTNQHRTDACGRPARLPICRHRTKGVSGRLAERFLGGRQCRRWHDR
jgi:hypothetical protein